MSELSGDADQDDYITNEMMDFLERIYDEDGSIGLHITKNIAENHLENETLNPRTNRPFDIDDNEFFDKILREARKRTRREEKNERMPGRYHRNHS